MSARRHQDPQRRPRSAGLALILGVAVLAALEGTAAATETATAAPDWLRVQARVELERAPGAAADAGHRETGEDAGSIAVPVGAPFHLIIEAAHAPGQLALLPEALALGDKLAERRAGRHHDRSGHGAEELDRYDLQLLAFEPGEVTIPAIPLALGSTSAATPPIPIRVETGFSEAERPVATSTRPEAMAELEKMAAEDPAPTPVLVDDYRPLYAVGTALALLLLAFAAHRLWRNRRGAHEPLPPPPAPSRPAHMVALERLEALRAKGLVERGELKPYFVELSEVVREYLGGRYGFESLEMTIDELTRTLSGLRTPGLEIGRVKGLLEACDLVKFAKYVPETTEAIDGLNQALEIVQRTRPVEAPLAPPATATRAEVGP